MRLCIIPVPVSVADPRSGAFLPLGSGIQFREEFFPDPEGEKKCHETEAMLEAMKLV
jgi:hypothetical protein